MSGYLSAYESASLIASLTECGMPRGLIFTENPYLLYCCICHRHGCFSFKSSIYSYINFHIQSNIKTRLITATDKSSHKNAVIYISLFARFISSYSISRRPSPMYFSSQASRNTLHHPPAAPLKPLRIRTLSGLSWDLRD